MGKLRLNLDQLTVDSFDTSITAKEKGTVFGEQCTCNTVCTCPGCPSCDATCPATCAYTCDDWSCGGSCFYTECGGNTYNDPTCDPSNVDPRQCCPY
jgi:hypothetical protein